MKKSLFTALFFAAVFAPLANAEDFQFNAYYPAPAANYSQFRLVPQSAITPDTNCPVGTFYSNASDNSSVYYCAAGSPSQYVPIPGVWTLNGDDLYPSDTLSRTVVQLEAEKVGIGTNTPVFKLTIADDGGILAADTGPDTTTTAPSGIGTRMFFHNSKFAFRAGGVGGSGWDEASIGSYSAALGNAVRAIGSNSVIWGGNNNQTSSSFSMILGGKNNTAGGISSSAVGGESNTASGASSLAAGYFSQATNSYNISLGNTNVANATSYASISGGANNTATGPYSAISGGAQNTIASTGTYSVIHGGRQNSLGGNKLTILGGYLNKDTSNPLVSWSGIGGGTGNTLSTDRPYFNPGYYSFNFVAGGQNNSMVGTAAYSAIAGGLNNSMKADIINTSTGGSIAGGSDHSCPYDGCIILGGKLNSLGLIIGGSENTNATGPWSIVAGRNMYLQVPDNLFYYGVLWGYSSTPITPVMTNHYGHIPFIIYSGRVGIRDTNPAALLEINGNGSSDDYLALTTSEAATVGDRLIIKNNGLVGVNQPNPQYPLHFGNGAYVDTNGNFMPASSRKFKEHISDLDLTSAADALEKLDPVRYTYKAEKGEEYVGFIAEDVPDLVADQRRQGLAPMDIAAVLTKMIQQQDSLFDQQEKESKALLKELNELKNKINKRRSSNSYE